MNNDLYKSKVTQKECFYRKRCPYFNIFTSVEYGSYIYSTCVSVDKVLGCISDELLYSKSKAK